MTQGDLPYSYARAWICPFLIILILITLAVKYAEPLKDGDLWFQMAYGQYLLDNHTLVPDHTIYSWTPTDGKQIYCAWIAEILFYTLYKIGGLNLLFTFRYVCLLVFIVFIIHHAQRYKVAQNPVTWLICLIGSFMIQAGVQIKPEIFSLLFMTFTVWTWWFVKSSPEKGWKRCYLFPAIILVWMNTHGGVIFGIAYLGLLFIGEVLNGFISQKEKLTPKTRKHFFISMALCVIAVFLTPYGWRYPYDLIQNLIINSESQVRDFKTVLAYQTIFFQGARWQHYLEYFIIGGAILGILFWPSLKGRKLDWPLVLTNIGFGFLYMEFVRTTYFWGIIFIFSAIYLIHDGFAWWRSWNKFFSKYAAIISVILFIILSGREMIESICKPLFGFWINYVNPVEEAEYIRKNFQGHHIGNDYDTGSYLLWYLKPEKKVFIDARYFPYKSWYHEYAEFEYGRSKKYKDQFINKYPCDLWCVTYDFPQLSYFLKSPDWKLVHYGPSACIFVRKDMNITQDGFDLSKISQDDLQPHQAYKLIHFSLQVGEIDTAVAIAQKVNTSYFCPQKKKLIAYAYMELGEAFSRKGSLDISIEFYLEALHIGKIKDPEVYNRLGGLYCKKQEFIKAVEQYNKALAYKKDYTPALHNLSVVYSQMGRFNYALYYLQRMIELQPNNPEVYYNVACIYSKQKKVDEAIDWLNKAIERGFNNWSLLRSDNDLANIRQSAYYQNIIKNH